MNTDLETIEQLKRLIVDPVIASMQVEMKVHFDQVTTIVDGGTQRIDGLDTRVKTLENNQKKALLGWGVITVAVGTAVTTFWNYIKTHIHLG